MGVTALHVMSELKDLEGLALLLLRGAVVDACDARGRPPLHYALLSGWDEGSKVLLKYGSHVKKKKEVYGLSPLDVALGRGQLTDEALFRGLAEG